MNQLPAGVGASDSLFNHSRPNDVKRSRFDLSRITNLTLDSGMIVPFDTIPVFPGDDVNLNFEMVLDTLPLVQPSLTSYKVVTHWYYMKARDAWKGFKTFSTKGRTGNVELNMPKVDLLHAVDTEKYKPYTDDTAEYDFKVLPLGSHSLASFLGVPSKYNGVLTGLKSTGNFNITKAYLPYVFEPDDASFPGAAKYKERITTGFNQYRYVNALPFMMYQSIVKNNYVSQNLLQDNVALFPIEGDDDWLLPYAATVTNYIGWTSNDAYASGSGGIISDKAYSYDGVFSNTDTAVRLDLLRYASFDDDYFTTGLPWLQRGDQKTLDVTFQELTGSDGSPVAKVFDDLDIYSRVFRTGDSENPPGPVDHKLVARTIEHPDYPPSGRYHHLLGLAFQDVPENDDLLPNKKALIPQKYTSFIHRYDNPLIVRGSDLTRVINSGFTKNLIARTSLSANQLRELIAYSVWQERNARVNGSYNAMIYQHWRVNPRSEEHLPQYIGGTADYVSFSTVLQNSASTSEAPLGSTAGFGSTRGNGFVGNFHVPDYGYIMAIIIIKPNTTYQQGVEHHLCCENVFDDMVQPEFEGLSPQPILNKELYVSDNDSDNDDLFSYQERYTYLKVRQNVNRGLFQCKPEKDRLFGSFTQARWFQNKPKLSYQFLCMSPQNMRRDFLAYPSYPMFRCQLASKVFVTRSLSYTSEPQTFGF